MVQPIDYRLNVQQPVEALVQGLRVGSGIADIRAKQQAAQKQRQQTESLQADLASLASNANPRAQDYAQLITKYPQLSEQLKRGWDVMESGQRQAKLQQGTQVYAALQGGNYDIAKDLLAQQAAAYRNSGDEQYAKSLEDSARLIDLNPTGAKNAVGLMLSSIMGPEKFSETFAKLGEERRAVELQPGAIKKQAAELGLTEAQTNKYIVDAKKSEAEILKTNAEAGKVAQEAAIKKIELSQKRFGDIELSKDAEKLINESVTTAANMRSLSNQYETLADQFDADIASGVPGRVEESVKRFTGNENLITRLRQEYKRLRNSQVLQNLPPGVASDKDIEIAMGAFPDDTANPEEIASFLRGVSKLQKYDASLNEIKADWVNSNGSLGKSRREITIGEKTYPRGISFSDVIDEQLELVSPIEAETVMVGGQQYSRPANFSDEQWAAYKQEVGAK